MPRKNSNQQNGVLQMVEGIQKRRRMTSSESTGWRNFGEGVWPTGQYVMKVRRNCAKKSLKSNQFTTQDALMASVWVHLCGTQNLHGLKSRASATRTLCWIYIIDSPMGQQHWLQCAETGQVKAAARAEKITLLDYFNYPHPNWANVTGQHEAELKYLGSFCGCWLSAQEEVVSLAWCETISRVMFKNLILKVLLCNHGHEVHRSLSQWASLQIPDRHT